MIKINLPNPNEMSIPSFFAQMRIAIKAAEKSYEEMMKVKDPEGDSDYPYILWRLPDILMNRIEETEIDPTDEDFQKLSLEIVSD